MKWLIALLFPFAALGAEYWGPYQAEYVDNYDGDSITIRFEVWRDVWVKRSVRLDGVDTPERGWRAKCDSEAQKGDAAKAVVKMALESAADLKITIYEGGKYGRLLVDLNADGKDLAALLIQKELARPYFGGRREEWCP